MFRVILALSVTVQVYSQVKEGDSCTTRQGNVGSCIKLTECQSALQDVANKRRPLICSYNSRVPLVCCDNTNHSSGVCPPLEDSATGGLSKTGQIAFDKCLDYLEAVLPCSAPEDSTNGNYTRKNVCTRVFAITFGTPVDIDAYPHMVALGFGSDPNTAHWDCGASLISEYFVLTAGHCTFSKENGRVTYARMGAASLKVKVELQNLYRVQEIIHHPQYKAPSKYHDLALLRMDRRVKFSSKVRPACLNINNNMTNRLLVATGWGAPEYGGEPTYKLLRVYLEEFTFEECNSIHEPNRQLRNGIINDLQLCVGQHKGRQDTCQGDSGGPLQSKHHALYCMYEIIGVTSFGKACGTPGVPGVYTRVAAYIPWIESVVWR